MGLLKQNFKEEESVMNRYLAFANIATGNGGILHRGLEVKQNQKQNIY